MVQISIGGMARDIQATNESWINEQINRSREGGGSICIRIKIKTAEVDLTFSSPGCPSSGRADNRELTRRENQVHELWQKMGLSTNSFTGGNVIAFLKQLERII